MVSKGSLYRFLVCLAPWIVGCAPLSTTPGDPAELPTPKLSADSVVMEVVLVKVPEDWDQGGQFWREVDEQHLAADARRRLQDNGLRTGLVGVQLPDVLRGYLDNTATSLDLSDGATTPDQRDLLSQQHRLQMRAGKSKQVDVTAPSTQGTVILINDEDNIRAMKFDKGHGLMELRAWPLGDGRIRLEATPTIEHGEVRQQWVSGQGTWVLDVNRPRQSFESLTITATMSPGQTTLITSTPESKGLGGYFFGLPASQQRSVLLIRLAQTQQDDLFSPPSTLQPIAAKTD